MAVEFEEGLARLADVENADDGGVLRECGEEVCVMRGGGDAEERRWVGECGWTGAGWR